MGSTLTSLTSRVAAAACSKRDAEGAERVRVHAAVTLLGSATSEQVADKVDLPKATVRRHLTALYQLGRLSRTGAGRKADPIAAASRS